MRVDGNAVTVQSETTPVRLGAPSSGPGGPDCSRQTTYGSVLVGMVVYEPPGSGPIAARLRSYRGAYFGSNAQASSIPRVGGGGDTLELRTTGCGDGDPATNDGFVTGFLPSTALAEIGLAPHVLATLSDTTVDAVIRVADNGRPAPATPRS